MITYFGTLIVVLLFLFDVMSARTAGIILVSWVFLALVLAYIIKFTTNCTVKFFGIKL